jgi:hypothetical protein
MIMEQCFPSEVIDSQGRKRKRKAEGANSFSQEVFAYE